MSPKEASTQKTSGMLSVCLVVASLYFAREVLIPIALATLFAFMLEPLAKWFERCHLGRISSALGSVTIAMLMIGMFSYFVMGQFSEFGNELPAYEKTIHEKLRKLETGDGGVVGHAVKSVQDFRKDLSPANPTNAIPGKAEGQEVKPVPVEVRNPDTSTLQVVRNLIGPSVNIVVNLFLVIIFCAFILVAREDLRSRLITIVGSRNVRITNQLLSDTGERVGRYLLMQFIVNVCYGIPVGLGLWAIGIPNPLLWGVIASVFRYIPYAGPWIAAALPFSVAFAIGSGWSKPALVLALFGVVEIITANLIEPWLYGNSTGITPLAVLVAAIFWTWLWGPMGLLLSVPLTVCVISIARYVPQLELLDQLFGEAEKEK